MLRLQGSVSYLDHVGPAYCCSKAAVDMLTKALAVDLGPHGIRVNLVQPTAMDTGMANVSPEFRTVVERKMLRQPINEFADVSDLTKLVLSLSSASSKMITGSSIPVDGQGVCSWCWIYVWSHCCSNHNWIYVLFIWEHSN